MCLTLDSQNVNLRVIRHNPKSIDQKMASTIWTVCNLNARFKTPKIFLKLSFSKVKEFGKGCKAETPKSNLSS